MLSSKLEYILNQAIRKANDLKHEFLSLECVLLALCDDEVVTNLFKDLSIDKEELKQKINEFLDKGENFSILSQEEIDELSQKQFATDQLRDIAKQNGINYQPEISLALQRVIQRAALHIQSSNKKYIQGINLLVAMFSEKDSHAVYFLNKAGVDRFKVVEKIAHGIDRSVTSQPDPNSLNNSGDPLKKEDPLEKLLIDYTTNLNTMAKDGKLDPIIGRQDELDRIIQILCRRRKNNPILVGDAGVGKTALAEGLAQLIIEGRVPEKLKDVTVFSLDMATVLAGTKFRGDFEERFKGILKALEKRNEKDGAILFIDEIHTIIGAGSTSGGSVDASNLLKPALSRGTLRCMGSTTFDEFRRFFEKDQALTRRFQKVDIVEPSMEDTIIILEGLSGQFEKFHNVSYSNEILKSIVELAQKYITERKLPDKAIDVLDEVGSYLAIKHKTSQLEKPYSVGINEVEKIISDMARIPYKTVSTSEKEKLQTLNRDLSLLIYGQDHAVKEVSNAIILSRSGLRDELKPIASFLFTGPTGVGKTELARQLALTMGIHFERIDMSEYMEKHSVAKLIGAPPGYVGFDQGGILTEKISQHPYSVLLLDEIEKAHMDIYNILLQVMDHGKLTDSNGKQTDFRNVILIMTSNAGAKEMESGSIGLGGKNSAGSVENGSKRDAAIKNYFSPEFRNRLDSIVNFKPLQKEIILNIVNKFVMELENMLLEKNIELELEPEVREYLAENGYDPKLGARPIARLVNEKLRKPIATKIIFGDLEKGGKIIAKMESGEICLHNLAQTVG
ncbi:AAA family ATPase [Bacteriovoracaceae bacterium]|nr:AAA family ATPase [Bacteriovoracaceae bacterium]